MESIDSHYWSYGKSSENFWGAATPNDPPSSPTPPFSSPLFLQGSHTKQGRGQYLSSVLMGSQRSTDINVLLTICHILSLVDVIFL